MKWLSTSLGQVLPFSYGKGLPERDRTGTGEYAVMSSAGQTGSHNRALTGGPSVVIGRKGTIGAVYYCTEPVWPIDTTFYVEPSELVDIRFAFYLLQSLPLREMNSDSAVPGLNRKHAEGLQVSLPPVLEQRAIAATLGALDDKIESNKRLVDLLVRLVDAYFMECFGGRAMQMSLGDLAEIVDCLHSKKPDRANSQNVLMQLNNIRSDGLVDRSESFFISDADYAKWSRKLETRPWDLVITNVGRIGAFARIPADYSAALGRNMTGIRPRDPLADGGFLAAAMRAPAVRNEIELRTDAGTIMNALNVRNIPHLRLPESSDQERRRFHDTASPLFLRADAALSENVLLATTRDSLLPALLSGRARVPVKALA